MSALSSSCLAEDLIKDEQDMANNTCIADRDNTWKASLTRSFKTKETAEASKLCALTAFDELLKSICTKETGLQMSRALMENTTHVTNIYAYIIIICYYRKVTFMFNNFENALEPLPIAVSYVETKCRQCIAHVLLLNPKTVPEMNKTLLPIVVTIKPRLSSGLRPCIGEDDYDYIVSQKEMEFLSFPWRYVKNVKRNYHSIVRVMPKDAKRFDVKIKALLPKMSFQNLHLPFHLLPSILNDDMLAFFNRQPNHDQNEKFPFKNCFDFKDDIETSAFYQVLVLYSIRLHGISLEMRDMRYTLLTLPGPPKCFLEIRHHSNHIYMVLNTISASDVINKRSTVLRMICQTMKDCSRDIGVKWTHSAARDWCQIIESLEYPERKTADQNTDRILKELTDEDYGSEACAGAGQAFHFEESPDAKSCASCTNEPYSPVVLEGFTQTDSLGLEHEPEVSDKGVQTTGENLLNSREILLEIGATNFKRKKAERDLSKSKLSMDLMNKKKENPNLVTMPVPSSESGFNGKLPSPRTSEVGSQWKSVDSLPEQLQTSRNKGTSNNDDSASGEDVIDGPMCPRRLNGVTVSNDDSASGEDVIDGPMCPKRLNGVTVSNDDSASGEDIIDGPMCPRHLNGVTVSNDDSASGEDVIDGRTCPRRLNGVTVSERVDSFDAKFSVNGNPFTVLNAARLISFDSADLETETGRNNVEFQPAQEDDNPEMTYGANMNKNGEMSSDVTRDKREENKNPTSVINPSFANHFSFTAKNENNMAYKFVLGEKVVADGDQVSGKRSVQKFEDSILGGSETLPDEMEGINKLPQGSEVTTVANTKQRSSNHPLDESIVENSHEMNMGQKVNTTQTVKTASVDGTSTLPPSSDSSVNSSTAFLTQGARPKQQTRHFLDASGIWGTGARRCIEPLVTPQDEIQETTRIDPSPIPSLSRSAEPLQDHGIEHHHSFVHGMDASYEAPSLPVDTTIGSCHVSPLPPSTSLSDYRTQESPSTDSLLPTGVNDTSPCARISRHDQCFPRRSPPHNPPHFVNTTESSLSIPSKRSSISSNGTICSQRSTIQVEGCSISSSSEPVHDKVFSNKSFQRTSGQNQEVSPISSVCNLSHQTFEVSVSSQQTSRATGQSDEVIDCGLGPPVLVESCMTNPNNGSSLSSNLCHSQSSKQSRDFTLSENKNSKALGAHSWILDFNREVHVVVARAEQVSTDALSTFEYYKVEQDDSLRSMEVAIASACSTIDRFVEEREVCERLEQEARDLEKQEREAREHKTRERGTREGERQRDEREARERAAREVVDEREERETREREELKRRTQCREQKERERNGSEEAHPVPARLPVQESAIEWPCEHYKRKCHVKFPCCDVFYPCHRCHNRSGNCKNTSAKALHSTHLQCRVCLTEQEINEDSHTCTNCNTKLSDYFCGICKHYTGIEKTPYHCQPCGICRIHTDRSFHCDVCNVCLDKKLKNNHKCRPNSGHDECCICLEDVFSGCQILPCSHKVHRDCGIAMLRNGVRKCPVCRYSLYRQDNDADGCTS